MKYCFILFLLLLTIVRAQDPMIWSLRNDVVSPGNYTGAAMAFHAQQGVTLLFGGTKGPLNQVSNDLWQFNGTAWQEVAVTGAKPVARDAHSMLYDPVDQKILMFGGDSGGGNSLNDLWSFTFSGTAAGFWTQLPSLPGAGRRAACFGYDASRDQILVVGGILQGTAEQEPAGGGAYGTVRPATRETWIWNRTAWVAGPTSPQYINGPVQNLFDYYILAGPAQGVVAHHGATGKTLLLSERIHGMAGVPVANFFYGAGDYPQYDGLVWENNLGGNRFSSGQPPAYFYVSSPTRVVATYDVARKRVIALGAGRSKSEEFDGNGWGAVGTNVTGSYGTLPVAGARPCIAYDVSRNVTVLYNAGGNGDTRELIENPVAPFVITTDLNSDPLEPCSGETISMTGAASGAGAIKMRWYRDSQLVSDVAGTTLTISGIQPNQAGLYRFEAHDSSGRILVSSSKPVYVHTSPQINTPPEGKRVVPGEGFSLLVNDTSSLPVSYQWFKDGQVIPGAIESIYRKANATVADAGLYRVRLTTRCIFIDSSEVRVHVGPTILTQPTAPLNRDVLNGDVSLSVSADGVGAQVGTYSTGADPTEYAFRHAPGSATHPMPMSFQWRYEGKPLNAGTKYAFINTATSSQLVIHEPDYEDEGAYDCVVSDVSGIIHAKLTTPTILILHPLTPPYTTIQHGNGPQPRSGSGMVYDSKRKRTVLFGGYVYGVNPRSSSSAATYFYSNDTWEWDGLVWVKRNPSTKPPVLAQFGMAYDATRGKTVVYGGAKYSAPSYSTFTISNEVWEWDGEDWRQVFPTIHPHARTHATMCFDSVRNEILMIGGYVLSPEPTTNTYGVRKQLWAWNGVDWTYRGTLPGGEGAPLIYGEKSAFAFDVGRGVAVLFAPFNDSGVHAVWEWNGTAWTQRIPLSYNHRVNDSRFSPHAFYDPVRRRIGLPCASNNLAGSATASVPVVIWWNGVDFQRGDTLAHDDISQAVLTDAVTGGPLGQGADLAAFDTHRRCFVWHDSPQFLWDGSSKTREMHFSAKVKTIHQPLEVVFFPNQTVRLRAIHAGRRPLVHQWLKETSPVLDDSRISGSATASLQITNATAADSGSYSLRATNLHNQVTTQSISLRILSPDALGTVVQGSGLILHWANGTLECSNDLSGAWVSVPHATSPYTVPMDEGKKFFRVKAS